MSSLSPYKDLKTPKSKQKDIIKQQQLKQIILKNQNNHEKGYYTFQEWKSLHSLLFTLNEYHITTTVINCWRMLKLINFGDDFVPTGLVYDCLMTLINVDQTVQQTQYLLKRIFFKFIQFNGKFLSKQQKQQLAFFKVVRNIVEGYRKIITDNLDIQSNFHQESSNFDRNQQLYRLHNVMVYKKNLQKLKKIQTEFKQCTFEPEINQYSAEIGSSRYKSKKKKNKTQNQQNAFGAIDQSQQFDDQNTLFRANPVPSYPQISPPGLQDHLQRMQRSRQILRINSLNNSSRHIPPSVQQFSIDQRTQQRKKHKIQNCRILFMIKVQVGKRIYRVKVRENMNVKQTVEAIQKMVGFKSNQIEDVVKGYFLNWQKREQLKKSQKIKQDCVSLI